MSFITLLKPAHVLQELYPIAKFTTAKKLLRSIQKLLAGLCLLQLLTACSGDSPTAPIEVTPPTPTAIAPSGSISANNPTYSWSASAGATAYLFWIGTGSSAYFSVNFSASELGCASGTGTCSVTPATPLITGTTYNWNVKANNTAGFSAASNSLITTVGATLHTIVAPTLISPNGSISAVNPTYTWNASAGATSYLLWIGTGASAYFSLQFSAGELGCTSGTGICSANPTTPLVAGVAYNWNVKALDTAGGSATSTAASVIVNAVPTGVTPAPLAFNEQPFGELQLVDTIDTATQAPWEEDVAGPSAVQTVLGQKARTLAPGLEPLSGGARFMTYRIGAGKGLIPHQAYVLDIEYPDDVPRAMFIANRGADFIRGFATGMALGDARNAYSVGTVESLNYPQTQTWKHYQSLFFLHERFTFKPQRYAVCSTRPLLPADGFDVSVFQTRKTNDPFSQGTAIGKIRLYKVVNAASLPAPINYPGTLPKRHIFWREEMADEAVGDSNVAKRAVANITDWYGFKMDLGSALGFNTVGKDLMEFGFNQGFDSGNPNWISNAQPPIVNEWANIVAAASARNLYLMPYLEYGGSQGNNCLPGQTPAWPCDKTPGNYFSLGYQHRPVKLFDGIFMPGGDKNDVPGFLHNYTGTYWTENLAADVTDPDIRTDLHFLIDRIAGQYKDTAKFAGIWLRTRQTKLPMSFSAATIARYNAANPNAPRTLLQLQSNEASRQAYYDWWYAQRASLLEHVRDYTRTTLGDKAPQVLFTAYATEPVPGATASATSAADWVSLVTDKPDLWQAYVDTLFVGFSSGTDDSNDPYRWYRWAWGRKTPAEALAERIQKNGLDKTVPLPTFPSADPTINSCVSKIAAFVTNGGNTPWECWQEEATHATPPADPKNYQGKEGVAMTYEFGNALYSVADVPLLNEYSGSAGQSLIHHYPLNEDEGSSFNDGNCSTIYAMDDQQPFDGKVGYISVATERAGPFSTLAEARALANGNPVNLGYLESSSMSRGFPAYVKRFNQALLSLPALPALKINGQTSDDEVVLKKIASSAGTYYAVINTAMVTKTGIVVDFGAGTTQVKDLLINKDYIAQKLSFDLYPGEVRTFRAP